MLERFMERSQRNGLDVGAARRVVGGIHSKCIAGELVAGALRGGFVSLRRSVV